MLRILAGLFASTLIVAALAFTHVSARTSLAPAPTETAVLTGTLADGGLIPLPMYQDGSEASEAECQWFVSANTATVQEIAHQSNTSELICRTQGRVVQCYSRRDASVVIPGTANYMIIAVRGVSNPAAAPSEDPSVRESTWGGVKARFGG